MILSAAASLPPLQAAACATCRVLAPLFRSRYHGIAQASAYLVVAAIFLLEAQSCLGDLSAWKEQIFADRKGSLNGICVGGWVEEGGMTISSRRTSAPAVDVDVRVRDPSRSTGSGFGWWCLGAID